jgi:hypothetical protein
MMTSRRSDEGRAMSVLIENPEHDERIFPATDDLRFVVSEGYPWGTRWYVWRETRQPDGSWDDGKDHQVGTPFRSAEKAYARAEALAMKARGE